MLEFLFAFVQITYLLLVGALIGDNYLKDLLPDEPEEGEMVENNVH